MLLKVVTFALRFANSCFEVFVMRNNELVFVYVFKNTLGHGITNNRILPFLSLL
jgi:hypothetical protein